MPTKTEIMHEQIRHLVRRSPFMPFEINLENGERLVVEHPELIAFNPDPPENGSTRRFAVISNNLTYTSSFDSVSSVAEIDRGQTLDESTE